MTLLNDSKKIARNIFSLSAAEIVSKGLQFYLAFYLMTVLGVENYGIWTFAKTHVMFYLVAVMLGFNTVGTREIAKNESLLPKYVNTIFTLRLFSSVLAFGIMIIIVKSTLIGEEVKQVVVLISGIKIFSDALLLNWVFDGLQKMHINAIRSISTSIIGTSGIVILVNDSNDIILAAWIFSLAFLLNTIWMLIYYSKKYSLIRFDFDFIFIKKLIKSSLPIGIAFFIINLYNSLDSQMLEYLFEDVNISNYYNGVYGAAHQVLLAAMIPSGIIQGAFFPQFSQKFTNPIDFNDLMIKYSKMTFLTGIFGGTLIFLYSNDLVDLLLNTDYHETGSILKLLAVTIIITYVNITYFAPLIASGLERQVLWANALGLIFNAIFNLVLIPDYNVYGAAIATISSEIGVLIFLAYLFNKRFGKLYLHIFFKMLLISVLSCLPVFLSNFFNISFLIEIMACILFFIILNLIFGTISIKEIKGFLK